MHGTRSDRELALAAANGERDALAVLLDRHYERIHRLAWRLTGSQTDAEDVAQDVCVKLATAVRSYRGDAEFGTWIWRIAHNAATDVLRQRQRIKVLEPSEMMSLVDDADAGAPARWATEARDDSEGLWAAVRMLSGQQREAVLLVYGEEQSHAQAAATMGCSEKTVSWHLHEARKRLKVLLEASSANAPELKVAKS
ncbi:MAG: RNA polymerase sigma factor [Hyphomicrobiaceae bacterium]